MTNVISYQTLISDLEDKKWDMLIQHGEVVAAQRWGKLDARLNQLYRWCTQDIEQRIADEVLDERKNS